MAAARRYWLSLEKPASFSSAANLARARGKKRSQTKKELEKSILFQVHRDLQENFERRSNFTTFKNQTWEMDLASFSNRIKPELVEQTNHGPGRRPHVLVLVVVDRFTRAIYAEPVKSKRGKDVAAALEKVFTVARGTPKTLVSDRGLEFRNNAMTALCEKKNIRQQFAHGKNKASQSERAVRSLKKVVMASVQSDRKWPKGLSWSQIPELVARALRRRYNRSVNATPSDVASDKKTRKRVREQEWRSARFQPLASYVSEEKKLEAGGSVHDAGQDFALGDYVLPPIQKQRRAEIRDKDYMQHYELMPMRIVRIFHGRFPRLYALKNLKTGRKAQRLFYGREIRKVALPVPGEEITDARIEDGRVEYKTKNAWVPAV